MTTNLLFLYLDKYASLVVWQLNQDFHKCRNCWNHIDFSIILNDLQHHLWLKLASMESSSEKYNLSWWKATSWRKLVYARHIHYDSMIDSTGRICWIPMKLNWVEHYGTINDICYWPPRQNPWCLHYGGSLALNISLRVQCYKCIPFLFSFS